MTRQYQVSGLLAGGIISGAHCAMASTGLPIDGAISMFQNLFILGAWFLMGAGTIGIVYSLSDQTYSTIFGKAVSLLSAVAFAGGFSIAAGLVGVTAAATLP